MPESEELKRALDRGELTELPPNVPPGFLGEVAPDMRKVDEFKPTLSAGILQESTPETRLLTIVLLYLLVITFPAALWVLWRTPRWSVRRKVAWTAVMVAGYAVFALFARPVV
ncbi:MAG: hypothetical protein Q7W30_07830 [Coriobacteriia bacterium]|nr:hypothetical protein [Coriobacteriia bacterium]